MTDKAEEDLIALVAREQRGFRRVLFAGVATLLVLVAMSAALGVYYFMVSQRLAESSRDLQREAFETRRRVDAQNNRVAAQEVAIRRAYDEIRNAGGLTSAVQARDVAAAVEAARVYLQRGRQSLADERLIEAVARSESAAATPAVRALLSGVVGAIAWERSGEDIPAAASDLPEPLRLVEADYEQARADANLAPLAATGLAWVRFTNAASARSNYKPADCEAVLQAVSASAEGPRALYWQAQCERKMGRASDSLRDYARALEESARAAASSTDIAELTLAMNAFHGVGTTLIAAYDASPDDPGVRLALEIAARECPAPEDAAGSERMRLALGCLRQAIELRRKLRQTENQLSGSGENVSFAYLRDGNFAAAYDNAVRVEHTGLFAWNELMRAMTAEHVLEERDDAVTVSVAARRNVSFFDLSQFNVCELQALLDAELYQEALAILSEEHGEEVTCAPAA